MVAEQKRAVFILAVFAAALLVMLALVPLLGRGAWGGSGIIGLGGFAPLLFRRRKPAEQVDTDERDMMIRHRAALAGGMTSYLVFVLACMGAWFVQMVHGRQQISIHYLPLTAVCGMIALFVTHSVVTLVMYATGGDDGED